MQKLSVLAVSVLARQVIDSQTKSCSIASVNTTVTLQFHFIAYSGSDAEAGSNKYRKQPKI